MADTEDKEDSIPLPRHNADDVSLPTANRILYGLRDARLFESMGTLKKYPKNKIFVEPGDPPKYCYLLKKGCVIGFEYTADGDERIYDIHLPVSMILETRIILNSPSPIYFKTIKPSELVCISAHALLAAIRDDAQMMTALLESLANKFHVAMEQVRETKIHDTEYRFCNLLLMFAECFGVDYDGKILIREQVSQQVFADLLGVNRITINRIAKTLKNMGLIELINGCYCLPDTQRLQKHMSYAPHPQTSSFFVT
jgi:CRP/FNR family transcriptional regulator